MRSCGPIVTGSLYLAFAHASNVDQGRGGNSAVNRGAYVEVTINPETRLIASFVGRPRLAGSCGSPIELQVKIFNQGFVTGRMQAELVGEAQIDRVKLKFEPNPLLGIPAELRILHITLTQPALRDLTIAFTTHAGTPDLSGRNRIHVLVRCT